MLDRELTLIFDEGVQGFTSFQTYAPDTALSINNRFLSFKRGRVWEHYIDTVDRNEFYDINNDSIIRVIFNDNPSNTKNFKTIGYEGEGTWGATIQTDQESEITDRTTIPPTRTDSGSIDNTEFVNRKGKQFGYIRGGVEGTEDLSLESIFVEGLGEGTRVGTSLDTLNISDIPLDLYETDRLYFFQSDGAGGFLDAINFLGTVTAVDRVTNDITYTFNTDPIAREPTTGDFFLVSKSPVAEKSGVIGFYGIVEFRSSDTLMNELFSINTEILVSNN